MPDGHPATVTAPIAAPLVIAPVTLHAIATATPPHVLDQDAVEQRSRAVFAGRGEAFDRLLPVYRNAGIETRYSCVPIEWYLEPCGWHDRNALFIDNAVAVLRDAATRVLASAGLTAADIDAMVIASTTGIATPSLDARLMQVMNFRDDVIRMPISRPAPKPPE